MQSPNSQNPQPIPCPMPQDLNPSAASRTGTAGQGILQSPSLEPGNRAMRRAASKKKKGLPPQMPSESRLLHQRVSQNESELLRLGNAFDQNSGVFSEGLKMLEVMGLIMQRVMNDMANGTVRCFGDEPSVLGAVPVRTTSPLQIDFNSYLREYWLCMLLADFARWCGTIATHDKPLIETVSQADVHEFGG